jgi:hypothetical protein
VCTPGTSGPLVAGFIRPVIRAVPAAIANRLGHCRIVLVSRFESPDETSQWSWTEAALEISIRVIGEEHDTAMELLVCLGQALWQTISSPERQIFWKLIDAEIRARIESEIDEDALEAKRRLLANIESARSSLLLEQYGRASFAATAAEYIHCLWHDVTIRTGSEFLPERQLQYRLSQFARWFPPNPGYHLFPRR